MIKTFKFQKKDTQEFVNVVANKPEEARQKLEQQVGQEHLDYYLFDVIVSF